MPLLYFSRVFARKKKNKRGAAGIQIIDKSSEAYQLHRTAGSSKESTEIERLYKEGRKEIERIIGTEGKTGLKIRSAAKVRPALVRSFLAA